MSNNKTWNRSSALSPEVLAILNTATEKAVQRAIQMFESALADASLTMTYEQKVEAYSLLVNQVTKGIADFVETLKA